MLFVDSQKDVAIPVAYGPYIHFEINFSIQRLSYSVHKGRLLVKPMLMKSNSGDMRHRFQEDGLIVDRFV